MIGAVLHRRLDAIEQLLLLAQRFRHRRRVEAMGHDLPLDLGAHGIGRLGELCVQLLAVLSLARLARLAVAKVIVVHARARDSSMSFSVIRTCARASGSDGTNDAPPKCFIDVVHDDGRFRSPPCRHEPGSAPPRWD